MSERSTVTDGAELLALCSHEGARGLVLREPYSFKLLWHRRLARCSPKHREERRSNLSVRLHAVRLPWNSNSIYSRFMRQFHSDKYYPLQTLSWTMYTQCRHSIKTRARFCEVLVLTPSGFWHPVFCSEWNSLCFLMWSLTDLLYALSHGCELPTSFLFENVAFFRSIPSKPVNYTEYVMTDI